MAFISIKREVDLQPGLESPAVFHCSQGDKGTTIMVGLKNGGESFTIPSGATIQVKGSRSNGEVFSAVTGSGQGTATAQFTLTEDMTATAGPTWCEVVLTQSSNVLGTANFILDVEESPTGAAPRDTTDATWTWILNKLSTEQVAALGDDVIGAIQSKANAAEIESVLDSITEETDNLWWNGDVSISSEDGYTQFLLKNPLPAGTYTLSCKTTSEWTGATYSRLRFSTSQNADSMSGDTFIADCDITHDGTRHSATFTLASTAYSARVMSGTTVSGSSGYGSDWSEIQVETGSAATDYEAPFNAIDRKALRATAYITNANLLYTDVNDFPTNSIIGVNVSALSSLNHYPAEIGGEVLTISHTTDNPTLQLCFPFSQADRKIYLRTLVNAAWTSWNGIQTDPNYIGYDLYPTGDQTDRAAEINAVLNIKRTCRLAPGDYYISVLATYEGSEIIGCGIATKIIRLSSSTYNYMIRLRKECHLRNVTLVGSASDITVASNWDLWGDTPGICAIRIEGTGTGEDDTQRFRTEVSDVRIYGFAGAGIFVHATGQNPQAGCRFYNVSVRNCNAGIAFGQYAEFSRITGCCFNECYYGAVNNGGNNCFSNCDFSGNVQGLLMQDDIEDLHNSGHGSFVNCSFNHSDGNHGVAIELSGIGAGELFTGCNIFYGHVNITRSQAIVFNSCQFGSETPIAITEGGGVVFCSCIFRTGENTTTITDNTGTHFDDCYYMSGRAVDGTPS